MNRIEITGIDLVKFTKKVYELSLPQGFGFLQYVDNQLETKEAQDIIDVFKKNTRLALSLDYIQGRACKMNVFKEDNKLFINIPWYDHTDKQLKELLKIFDIELPKSEAHGMACNCRKCLWGE